MSILGKIDEQSVQIFLQVPEYLEQFEAISISVEGEISGHDESELDYERLKELVGGYVESIDLADPYIMILDEEGKVKQKPQNNVATLMMLSNDYPDYAAGDVVICRSEVWG